MMRARLVEELQRVISEYINRESNRRSMITVTSVHLGDRLTHADVFISVYPEKDTHAATDFLNRNVQEVRDYIKTHIRTRAIPRLTFLPDPVIGGTIEPLQ